jgi:protein-disulfide isomerase
MIFMDEGNTNNEPPKEVPPSEPTSEKKEKVVVIKKSRLMIVVAIIIIAVVAIAAFFLLSSPSHVAQYIADYSPILGSASATVNVIEFSDYECPFCQAAEGVNQEVISSLKQSDPSWQAPIPNIIDQYVNTGKVRLVFRNFPVHSTSGEIALAAACAQEQDKFWEYHKTLFENYNALSETDLQKYASDMNLNLTQFSQCLSSKKYQSEIDNDLADGRALGISGTPTFFIGNNETGYEKLVGAQSFSAFKQIIDSKISV